VPDKETMERVHEDQQEGKSPSVQAGEFVREEMHHIREGKHGARSPQQAIAIGLSKARRAGVDLPPPNEGQSSEVRSKAEHDLEKGRERGRHRTSSRRSRATSKALKREGRSAASHGALSSHSRSAARRRGPKRRHQSAMKAVRSKGRAGMRASARKAARTRSKKAA